jgi:hypothetical protein
VVDFPAHAPPLAAPADKAASLCDPTSGESVLRIGGSLGQTTDWELDPEAAS